MGDPDREVPQDPWEPVPWRITILAEVNEPEAEVVVLAGAMPGAGAGGP